MGGLPWDAKRKRKREDPFSSKPRKPNAMLWREAASCLGQPGRLERILQASDIDGNDQEREFPGRNNLDLETEH
jgi:hypothetical protein